MRGPLDLSRELLAAEVLHEIVHLRRRIDDAAELPDVLGIPAPSCCAVRLYDADAGLLAALVPAGTVPATTALAQVAQSGSVSATDPAHVAAATDYQPSLVAPIGLPADVRTIADVSLRDQEVVYTATGDGSTALKIRTADLLALCGAIVAPIVEPSAVPAQGAWAAEDAWRGMPIVIGATPYR